MDTNKFAVRKIYPIFKNGGGLIWAKCNASRSQIGLKFQPFLPSGHSSHSFLLPRLFFLRAPFVKINDGQIMPCRYFYGFIFCANLTSS